MNIRTILLFLTAFLMLFAACDIIEEPYMTQHHDDNGHNDEVVRKVLLEKFTGHQCVGCPDGADMAKTLQKLYGNKLVVVSIHAGWFAEASPGEFNYDFTTDTGEELNDFFGVSANPRGIVNRKEFEGSRVLDPSAWGEAIEEYTEDAPKFQLQINMEYHEADNELEVCVEVGSLVNSDCLYYLSVFLIEDGIVKPQKTNDPAHPGGVIMDYEHNNVLRKGVNGTWGDQLNDSPITAESQFIKNYKVSIDEEWVLENTSIVAFVYHSPTYEVVQVEMLPFTNTQR